MRTTGTILTAGPWPRGQHLMQEDGQFKFYVQIYPLKFQQECLGGLQENCHVSGTFGAEMWIFAFFCVLVQRFWSKVIPKVGEKLLKSLLFWGL